MLTVEINEVQDKIWDERILSGETGSLHLFHSRPWAGRLFDLLKYKPVYFSLSDNKEIRLILVGFIVPAHKLLLTANLKVLVNNFLRLVNRRRGFLWYGQPVFFKDTDDEAYKFLADSLNNFMKKEKLYLVYGEWPMSKRTLIPFSWKQKEWATLKIDLTRDLDAIYSSFKNSARKEIRKAQSLNIIVKKVENKDELNSYYKFAVQCAKRYKKRMYGVKDFLTSWDYLRGWGYFETFVAFYQEKMIGGLSVWGDKYNLMELGSFQSEDAFSDKLPCSDLIKWEAVKWGKSMGAKVFDLAGVNPAPITKKDSGIRQFKEKWSDSEHKYLILHT